MCALSRRCPVLRLLAPAWWACSCKRRRSRHTRRIAGKPAERLRWWRAPVNFPWQCVSHRYCICRHTSRSKSSCSQSFCWMYQGAFKSRKNRTTQTRHVQNARACFCLGCRSAASSSDTDAPLHETLHPAKKKCVAIDVQFPTLTTYHDKRLSGAPPWICFKLGSSVYVLWK